MTPPSTKGYMDDSTETRHSNKVLLKSVFSSTIEAIKVTALKIFLTLLIVLALTLLTALASAVTTELLISRGMKESHGILLVAALTMLSFAVLFGQATALMISQVYDALRGGKPSVRKSYRDIKGVIHSYFFVWVFFLVCTFVGYTLLFLPGALAYIFLCLAPSIVILERKGARVSLQESVTLGKKIWPTLAVLFLLTSVMGALPIGLMYAGIPSIVTLPLQMFIVVVSQILPTATYFNVKKRGA